MKLVILLIKIYQNIISVCLKNLLGVNKFCRFYPTCSEYARQSVIKYGAIKGGKLSILRLLKCQPWF